MKASKGLKALKQVAAQKGISIDEVRSEIQLAIDMAMANEDPLIREKWSKIPHKGDKPTPEEVIVYLSKQIKRGNY
mgnify:CR=1 FL=1